MITFLSLDRTEGSLFCAVHRTGGSLFCQRQNRSDHFSVQRQNPDHFSVVKTEPWITFRCQNGGSLHSKDRSSGSLFCVHKTEVITFGSLVFAKTEPKDHFSVQRQNRRITFLCKDRTEGSLPFCALHRTDGSLRFCQRQKSDHFSMQRQNRRITFLCKDRTGGSLFCAKTDPPVHCSVQTKPKDHLSV